MTPQLSRKRFLQVFGLLSASTLAPGAALASTSTSYPSTVRQLGGWQGDLVRDQYSQAFRNLRDMGHATDASLKTFAPAHVLEQSPARLVYQNEAGQRVTVERHPTSGKKVVVIAPL